MAEIDEIPKPSIKGVLLIEIKTISMVGHLYCVTPKHITHAANRFSGILGEDAIRDAERHGASCDICRINSKSAPYPKILSFDEHTKAKTLFIGVPQNKDLNKIDGLVTYLNEIKPICQKLNIEGFAFPIKF